MKIRTGFVSNSSSSSFIVGMWREPESVAEIKDWFFKYADLSGEATSEETEEDLIHKLATRMYQLLTDPEHRINVDDEETIAYILADIRETTVWYEYYESQSPGERRGCTMQESDEQKTYLDLRTKVIWKSFLNRATVWNVEPTIVRFEIGDHNHIDGILEHGDFIQAWPVIRINHH